MYTYTITKGMSSVYHKCVHRIHVQFDVPCEEIQTYDNKYNMHNLVKYIGKYKITLFKPRNSEYEVQQSVTVSPGEKFFKIGNSLLKPNCITCEALFRSDTFQISAIHPSKFRPIIDVIVDGYRTDEMFGDDDEDDDEVDDDFLN